MPSLISNLYAFGDFRLDSQNRLLLRGEEPIALTPKAFDVLLLLIQHSGQVVSKDELMRVVWPDSFVEESNLTQTVFMLRKALAETPDQRYIVTVQGRGYRFVADVREILEDEHGRIKASLAAPPLGEGVLPARTPVAPQAGITRFTQPPKRTSLILVGALVLIAIAGSFVYLRWSASRKQVERPRVRVLLAVLPFQNLTGDPSREYFSDGLTEEMITQLGNLDPGHLGVIARTSVMHYKNGQEPLD